MMKDLVFSLLRRGTIKKKKKRMSVLTTSVQQYTRGFSQYIGARKGSIFFFLIEKTVIKEVKMSLQKILRNLH